MAMTAKVLKKDLKTTKEIFSGVENITISPILVAQVIRCEMMNLRAGNAHTKTRGEVSGGGKKPWKQKGTGRARHGSTRSPIWVGGGVAHGPRNNRNWHRNINKTSRIAALKFLIKDRLQASSIVLFDDNFEYLKTKDAISGLEIITKAFNLKDKQCILLYTTEDKEKTKGFCNLELKLMNAGNLKLNKLAQSQIYIMTPSSQKLLEERIGK
jgi:large subunit ribosomal protein L4